MKFQLYFYSPQNKLLNLIKYLMGILKEILGIFWDSVLHSIFFWIVFLILNCFFNFLNKNVSWLKKILEENKIFLNIMNYYNFKLLLFTSIIILITIMDLYKILNKIFLYIINSLFSLFVYNMKLIMQK